jgi:nitric oxide reductase activation protein
MPTLPSLLDDTNSDGMGSIEEQQARLRNNDRQRQLVDDTAKLLGLANELKVDVDKSSKDTLSLDVIRKADEIEKLAREVKEKMKGS